MSINISDTFDRIRNNDCTLSTVDFRNYSINTEELKILKLAIKSNNALGNIRWGELPTNRESKSTVHAIENKLKNNILNYKYFPTAYEYGLLSIHSYTDAKIGEILKLADNDYDLHLRNWNVKAIYRNDENGYYGVLYQNTNTCQLVLAHRGTEFSGLKEELFGHKDVSTDINGIVLNKIVKPIYEAYLATENSIKIAKEAQLPLSFTGHSLGAWLAELSAYFSFKHLDYMHTRALTFDSPGSYDIFETLKSNIHSHHDNSYLEHLDIITYLSIPNVVNSCNGHIGEVYSVTPKITKIEIQNNLLNSKFLLPILTVLGHSLKSIITEFNATTGIPDDYKKMLDWPCITCDYKEGQDHVSGMVGENLRGIFSSFGKFASLLTPITMPIYKISNMFVDFVNGKFNLVQYIRIINNEVYFENGENNSGYNASERDFYSKFEGHYNGINHNPYIEPLKGTKTSADWYLKQLRSAFEYFSSPPEACGLTNMLQNTIKHLSVKYDYIAPQMYGKHPHGLLNATEYSITIDSLKQTITRLNDVSLGSLQQCVDLYEKPHLWYKEIAQRTDKHAITKITEELVSNSVNLDVIDDEGNNLLYYAVANNKMKAAEILMKNGIQVIKNNNAKDAYDSALENHNLELANNLKQYMHTSPNSVKIELDQYGIYDGNDQDNIFIIKSEFKGKKEGYKLVIDKFDGKDKIDLSYFSNLGLNDIELREIVFAGQNSIKITSKITNDDIVIILNSTIIDVVDNMILGGMSDTEL